MVRPPPPSLIAASAAGSRLLVTCATWRERAEGQPTRSGKLGLGGHQVSKAPMIAIIDDDESVRESTKELVSSLGYMAHTFASAEDFLSSVLLQFELHNY